MTGDFFSLRAPAKINWTLSVLDRRPDGYHNILSLLHCIDLHDTITFEPAERLELLSSMELPVDNNLVFRAARLLQNHCSVSKGAKMSLIKEIPEGAGLGGGSSDAACTLVGLSRLWGLGIDRRGLVAMASELGADVPFFFYCPLAVARHRGGHLRPLPITVSHTLVVVKPPVSVSTSWAYAALASRRTERVAEMRELTKGAGNDDNISRVHSALATGNLSSLGSLLRNDFEVVVAEAYPVIAELIQRLLEAGAVVARMSGSGSSVFGLFENRERAEAASRMLQPYWNRVADTLCADPADAPMA